MKTFSYYSDIIRARDAKAKVRAEANKERKYSMTKAQFSRAVKAMLNSIISIPDDLWSDFFPTVTIRAGDTEAFMGIRPRTREIGESLFKTEEGGDED